MESRSHYSDAAGHPEVPETHGFVLRAGGDHPASPRVQRQDVTYKNKRDFSPQKLTSNLEG